MIASIQKEDWERFRALGSVPPSIREVVLRSWVRSRDSPGLDALKRAPSLSRDELDALRSRNARLRRAAKEAVRRTGYLLDDAGAMLLLCDNAGTILDVTGDTRVQTRGQENHLHPGGRWQESVIGTNAIGTALALGKPVSISGVEHFCEAIQRWSCAAAPIRDPVSGQILGVVNISAPADETLRQGPAFSGSLAMQIEEALHRLGLQEQQIMIDRLLSRRGTREDGQVLLDRHGKRIWASASFRKVEDRFEAGSRILRDGDEDHQGDANALARRMQQALPEADIDLICERGEALGLIVTLPTPRPRRVTTEIDLPAIAATGPEMAAICDEAAKLVESGVPLLIKGPAGSGKETLASALHRRAARPGQVLEVIDCSLLDVAMLRGGDEGAWLQRLMDAGGTLVLDEPAETPPALQAALAQALAQMRRGAAAPVRIISLSSVPLSQQTSSGQLRADLYFRLSGSVVKLPALAERRADLPELVRLFCAGYSDRRKGGPLRFTPAAMLRLRAHDWPGNLRELRNLVEALQATSFTRLADVGDLPAAIAQGRPAGRDETLRDRERSEILDALAECGGNMTETARRLGISRSTLYLKLDQYGVPRNRRG